MRAITFFWSYVKYRKGLLFLLVVCSLLLVSIELSCQLLSQDSGPFTKLCNHQLLIRIA